MTTLVIDTYKTAQRLQLKGFSKEQAEGVIETLQELNLDELAAKSDIQSLRIEILSVKHEILKWTLPLILGLYGLILFKML